MDEHYIQSATNPLVKKLVRLQRRDGRIEHGLFMVEGRRAIDGFIAQGWIPQSYLLAEACELPSTGPRRCCTV